MPLRSFLLDDWEFFSSPIKPPMGILRCVRMIAVQRNRWCDGIHHGGRQKCLCFSCKGCKHIYTYPPTHISSLSHTHIHSHTQHVTHRQTCTHTADATNTTTNTTTTALSLSLSHTHTRLRRATATTFGRCVCSTDPKYVLAG